jgi:hypothetical protein
MKRADEKSMVGACAEDEGVAREGRDTGPRPTIYAYDRSPQLY